MILVKLVPSVAFVDRKTVLQAPSVMSRGFQFAQFDPECTDAIKSFRFGQHKDQNSMRESEIQEIADNDSNRRICLVCIQEGLLRPYCLNVNAF